MKESIFQFFQSFHNIFPVSITAAAQKAVSLAQPLSQMKTTMGNKNKTFPHTDGLPLFRSSFLSQNTLRTEWAIFKPICPSTTCSSVLGCFPRHYWTPNFSIFPSELPLPWLKWWPSIAVGLGMCLNPYEDVPCLLLVNSKRFGPAEKSSITGGAMCPVTPRAFFPVQTCAKVSDVTYV